jgi:hypothetical protein
LDRVLDDQKSGIGILLLFFKYDINGIYSCDSLF